MRFQVDWPEATVSTRSTLDVRVDEQAYEVDITLDVRDSGEAFAERRWHRHIARQGSVTDPPE